MALLSTEDSNDSQKRMRAVLTIHPTLAYPFFSLIRPLFLRVLPKGGRICEGLLYCSFITVLSHFYCISIALMSGYFLLCCRSHDIVHHLENEQKPLTQPVHFTTVESTAGMQQQEDQACQPSKDKCPPVEYRHISLHILQRHKHPIFLLLSRPLKTLINTIHSAL